MSRDLSTIDVDNWTTTDLIFWIKNTELIAIKGLIKLHFNEIQKLKIDGKKAMSLINIKENKTEDVIQFHDYCIQNLKITTFGTRERLYYALENLKIQRFSEMKPKKFSIIFDSSDSYSINKEEHLGDYGISLWDELEIFQWLKNSELFKNNEIEEIMKNFSNDLIDGYVLYKILTYPLHNTKNILIETLKINKNYLEKFLKASLSLYPLIKRDLARDLELKLPDECGTILEKIRSSEILSRKFEINDPKHLESIKSLCIKENFKNDYLNLDYKMIEKKQNKLEELIKKTEKLSIGSNLENSIEIKEEIIQIKKETTSNKNLKVKLLITELHRSTLGKNIIHVLSPILDICSLSSQVSFIDLISSMDFFTQH